MDQNITEILDIIDISYHIIKTTDLIVERCLFMNDQKYNIIKTKIPKLKEQFSSSFLTSLQKNATLKQKWPLLNFIRQILKKLN